MTVTLNLDEVHALTTSTLLALGASDANAGAIADTITAAERDECKSHGLFRLPGYCVALGNGRIDGKAEPVVAELAPAVVQVDAKGGFAPLALKRGREPLIEKARANGIAAMPVVNSYHFAALWYEVEALATEGLVAFAFVNSRSYVAPAGGTKPLFGTDPMAFGWPRKDRPPVVFDQASSASARGEIMLHHRDGKSIPEGWAIDKDGNSTTDPAAGLAGARGAAGPERQARVPAPARAGEFWLIVPRRLADGPKLRWTPPAPRRSPRVCPFLLWRRHPARGRLF